MSLLSRLAVQAARAYGILSARSTNVSADYLVVAGGGGAAAGGGGAGGLLASTATLSTLNTYSVTVGAGGTGALYAVVPTSGSNSVISGTGLTTITAIGGGGSGGTDTTPYAGQNGGSGGGAAGDGRSASGGTGTSGQGNNGGSNSAANPYPGGGGGGASAAGGNGSGTVAGNGGNGTASSISGSSVTYAGGGGAAGAYSGSTAGTGGSGGGGNGNASGNGTSGTANLGGGGGGACVVGFSGLGGSGGSGIVIISYTSATPKFVGGTITTSGGKQIHTFTSSGTLNPITPITASYLVVAGGGSGGTVHAGGGGAGGLLASSTTLYSGATYIVTVGAGGASQTSGDSNGFAGSNSVLSGTGLTTITATGGGLGGNSFPGANGGTGGSGGGGGRAGTGGAGTSGQGNNGGNGGGSGTTGGGGGGGAGAVGSNGGAQDGGAGGAGSASSITGTSTTYAGGGGGGIYTSNTGSPGVGGSGGGGAGGKGATTLYGTPGTQNTGGGGGGGGDRSGAGGSGIVIISYAGSQAFNGGLVTTSGGNTIHTFTSTGALTPLTNNLNNSLRFRGSNSAYLNRTPTVAGNRKTWTWSAWIKLGTISVNMGTLFIAQGQTAIYLNDGTNSSFRVNGAAGSDLITSLMPRDPSAWYHLVVACDTTQAVEANRLKIYVNGVQQTAFQAGSAYPTLNGDTYVNSTAAHYIGRRVWNSDQQYDGYMTDINFIDGQALEPYYFGNNDANGVWKPIQYKGTYGTNGFYLPFTNANTSTYSGSFNGSSQGLTFTPTSNIVFGSSDYTVEAWVNFSSISSTTQLIYQSGSSGTNNFYLSCQSGFVGVGTQSVYVSQQSTTLTANQWYHIVACRASGTLRLFVNGTQIGSSVTDSTSWLASGTASIGYAQYVSGQYLNGLISNIRVLKGTGLYTSNFIPPSSPLTAITNTQLLTLQNSSIVDNSANAYTITNVGSVTTSTSYPFSANIASDQSGNANNWITNNIQVATPSATTYDAMIDVPTNTSATVANYATWNPLERTAATYSEANLKVVSTSSAAPYNMTSTIQFPTTGKWYCEVEGIKGSNNPAIGMGNNIPSDQFAMYRTSGVYLNGGISGIASSGTPATWTTGDIIGIAYDASAGTLSFYKNGSLQSGGFTSIPATGYFVAIRADSASGDGGYLNCGQRPFSYTPPTGYVALNTYNLPTPTILQGNKYMDATLYTGNGGTQVIVNQAQFKPDFVWYKQRNTTRDNGLEDSVRGAQQILISNSTNAEVSASGITSFNSNGFTQGSNVIGNESGGTYVGWQWQAGQGSTSTNTSGSITSTVSVNTTAGFSIVTYTGTGSTKTFGHGLGVTPAMFIVKSRSQTGENWVTWHKSFSNTAQGNMALNTTDAVSNSASVWGNTAPTSTLITVGNAAVNNNTSTYVCYAWAEIAGYSAFGSYTGNSSTDGPFVYLGFRPKYILIRCTSAGYDWVIYDSSTGAYNVVSNNLWANLSNAEYSNTASTGLLIDLVSNGFKIRGTNTEVNNSGLTYIYAAYAENPFKNSNAR